jgi:tetratricopeptide (TPR) repeat protein
LPLWAPAAQTGAYVSPSACQPCHVSIASRYRHISMAQTFARVNELPRIETFPDTGFFHEKAKQFYRVTLREGRIFQERFEKDASGRKVRAFELEATHIIGSGRHARTYLHLSPAGELVELPLSWYSQEKRWAMSPGYDHAANLGFTRPIDAGCMFCHNGYPAGVRPDFAARAVWPPALPSGIDCQRCHGSGADHVRLAGSGAAPAAVRAAIVNPKRLAPGLAMDVCLQCHLQTTSSPLPHALRRFGKDAFSYRPGEPLTAHLLQFDHADGSAHEDKFEVNSAGYRLLQSACFRRSAGKLTCTTCHDPHAAQPVSTKACLQCHTAHPEPQRADCFSCHMPKRRSQDAVHVVLTEHRILRRPPPGDLVAPLEEKREVYRGGIRFYQSYDLTAADRSLYLGLALVTDGADVPLGIRLLREGMKQSASVPVEARLGLARALAGQNQPAAALAECRTVLTSRPALASARAECAKNLEKLGRDQAALEEYRRALADSPDLPAAALGIARLSRNADEAIRASRVAEQSIVSRPEALNSLGNLLTGQKKLVEAQAALEQALAIDPRLAEAENNLGRVVAMQGDLASGLSHLERALALDANFTEARFNRAQVLQALGRDAEALTEFAAIVEHRPDWPAARLAWGSALADAGRLAEAIREFQEALRLQPDNAEARQKLQLARQLLGK